MKISITKIWFFAILLILILLASIVVTVALQGKINRLNIKAAELSTLYTAEKQAHESVLEENKALRAENAEYYFLKSENKALRDDIETAKPYQLTVGVPNDYEIAIDQRLDPEIIKLIKAHFAAISAGNQADYLATLGNRSNEVLLWYFDSLKNTDIRVTGITADELIDESRLQRGGYFLYVSCRQDGQLKMYGIGVTKIDGEWVIYDND